MGRNGLIGGGVSFVERNRPYILAQSAVPVCLAPNGTVATNGIVTLGTALPTTYSGGIWLRLPANAIVSGAAGLYWAVMSSTTQGQVYTNFADPASEFIPFIPSGTPVAAVGSNAAYTQTTGADVTLVNVTLPAGALGGFGQWQVTATYGTVNNANSKMTKLILGASSVASSTGLLTSQANGTLLSLVRNRGVQNKQVANNISIGSGAGVGFFTEDTSASKAVAFSNQLSTATDFVVLDGFSVLVMPS